MCVCGGGGVFCAEYYRVATNAETKSRHFEVKKYEATFRVSSPKNLDSVTHVSVLKLQRRR